MRLLWEAEGFELVGAFCVGAFALLLAWIAVDGMFDLNAAGTGLLATATAAGILEAVSRIHYAADAQAAAAATATTSPADLERPVPEPIADRRAA